MDTAEKVRENRLRRMAARQGLTLIRSRRRDVRATDYGMYGIARDGVWVAGVANSLSMTLDDVEVFLTS